MPGSQTGKLREVAERIADALPPVVEEVVLTGSVSRGVADELSDVEMLLVTETRLDLTECFEHARTARLVALDTWGVQGTEVSRVFGYYEGIPIETIWWSHDFAEPPPTHLQTASLFVRPGSWRIGKRSSVSIRKRSPRHGSRRRRSPGVVSIRPDF
jgi:predicted nucleotidyltransferase